MTGKYRIHWKSNLTGVQGQGTGLFSLGQAKSIVDDLNNDEKNKNLSIHHWYELESESDYAPKAK